MTLLDLIVEEKHAQEGKVRRQKSRLPNKYNGTPIPPELPPGIPQEVSPSLPKSVGRWPDGSEWSLAEVRGLKMTFRRVESEDVLAPACPQLLQLECPPSVALKAWKDSDVNLQFDVTSLAGVDNLDFARKLAFVNSFPADSTHSLHLWSLLLSHLHISPPTWQALPGGGGSGGVAMLAEFDLRFSFLTKPHQAYCHEQAIKVTAHAAEAYVRPVGFGVQAKQKAYCEVAAHLLACAHEISIRRGVDHTGDITVYSFLLHQTSVKAWKATFPWAYLAALRSGKEVPSSVELQYTPSLQLNKMIHRHRAAALVLSVFASALEF